eukprot:1526749-Alexandrium_andersonii.AAC.1
MPRGPPAGSSHAAILAQGLSAGAASVTPARLSPSAKPSATGALHHADAWRSCRRAGPQASGSA